VQDADLGLVYDEARRAYRPRTRVTDTSGLQSKTDTRIVPIDTSFVADGRTGHRLTESARPRSFLALGVDARKVDRVVDVLRTTHHVAVLDLTETLISTMRAETERMTGLTCVFASSVGGRWAGWSSPTIARGRSRLWPSHA
jgi:hypothetical protein